MITTAAQTQDSTVRRRPSRCVAAAHDFVDTRKRWEMLGNSFSIQVVGHLFQGLQSGGHAVDTTRAYALRIRCRPRSMRVDGRPTCARSLPWPICLAHAVQHGKAKRRRVCSPHEASQYPKLFACAPRSAAACWTSTRHVKSGRKKFAQGPLHCATTFKTWFNNFRS